MRPWAGRNEKDRKTDAENSITTTQRIDDVRANDGIAPPLEDPPDGGYGKDIANNFTRHAIYADSLRLGCVRSM